MEVIGQGGELLSDADSRQAEFYELLRISEAARAKEDLFYLAKFVLGRNHLVTSPDAFDRHHRELCDFLMAAWRDRVRRPINTTAKIMMPRGTLKSTIVSEAFPIWVLLNWPETRILLDSETIAKPLGHLYVIKKHFENEYFQYLFGKQYDTKDRWNTEMLKVKRRMEFKEPSIDCAAVEASKTGSHYDLIIPDDLNGETNSNNREQILKVIQHAKQYESLLNQYSRSMVAFTGTRWSFNDIMEELDDWNATAVKQFRQKPVLVFEYICWKRDAAGKILRGQPEFPNILPVDVLNDARAKQGAYRFSCNYELNPVSDENAAFKKQWLRYHKKPNRDFADQIYISVDPAGAGDKYGSADSTAIVVGAIDSRFDIYVIRSMQGHWSHLEICNKLFELNEMYRPKRIGVETVFTQIDLFMLLKQRSKQEGKTLPLYEFTTSNKEKPHRIMGLQPFVEQGKFFLRAEGADGDLEDQMLRYPKVPHVDLLDATAYLLEFMTVPVDQQPQEYWRRDDWAEKFVPTVEQPEPPTGRDVRAWRYVDKVKKEMERRGQLIHTGRSR